MTSLTLTTCTIRATSSIIYLLLQAAQDKTMPFGTHFEGQNSVASVKLGLGANVPRNQILLELQVKTRLTTICVDEGLRVCIRSLCRRSTHPGLVDAELLHFLLGQFDRASRARSVDHTVIGCASRARTTTAWGCASRA